MKKSIALVAMAFGVSSAFAQDLTSKKGEPFLPEAGDWSIGVDATPFLNYAGNFFGKTGFNAAPTWNNYSLNQSITGKYFKDANTAYRATIRLGMDNHKQKATVTEHAAPATITAAMAEATAPKFDIGRVSNRNVVLGIGLEKRRGKTRLQGFYGGELFVWGGSTKEKYKYANKLTQVAEDGTTAFQENIDANDGAYTHDFAGDFAAYGASSNISGAVTGYTNVDAARVLKRKTNGQIGVGVRAFIGAEYFIAPKISIGGEFGWGIGYALNTKDKSTWDAEGTAVGGSTQEAKELKAKDYVNGGGHFLIDTDRNASNAGAYNLLGGTGTIRLNFHF